MRKARVALARRCSRSSCTRCCETGPNSHQPSPRTIHETAGRIQLQEERRPREGVDDGADSVAWANHLADCDFNLAALHPAYPIMCRTSTQRTQAPESVDIQNSFSALDPLENSIRPFRTFPLTRNRDAEAVRRALPVAFTRLIALFLRAPRNLTGRFSNERRAPVSQVLTRDGLRPTLLLDEAETFVGDSEDLPGVLNSGHTRDTARVIRLVAAGDDYEPKAFSTWAAKALASIGKLAATLGDRGIIIPMKRRKVGEKVATDFGVESLVELIKIHRESTPTRER